MRIIFAGTPQIAVPSLEKIAAEFDICAVLTGTDKKAGRGNRLHFSPVKSRALELGLPVLQPEKFDDQLINQIKTLTPDLLVVAAYWKIFPDRFIDIFPLGGINLHPSLLPKFRGASPIPATILAGETEGGVTIQKMALKMDTGDILLQEKVKLDGRETTASLTRDFSILGSSLIIRVLRSIREGHCRGTPQDHSQASYCRQIKKEEGLINWQESAEQIDRKIRAFFPWPGSFTFIKGKRLVISRATLYAIANPDQIDTEKAGYVINMDKDRGILIKTGAGILAVTRLQLESRKETDFKSFLNGHSSLIGSHLGV